jgi:hypothetical protein
MIRKSEKYWWIATIKREPYKRDSEIIHKHITLYIWWDEERNFSATPLRSRIKRVKQRMIKDDKIADDVKECSLAFQLSRSRQTKHILSDLVTSISKHSMAYSNVPPELKTYLRHMMHNMHYTPACIATIVTQLNAITQKVEATKKESPGEPMNTEDDDEDEKDEPSEGDKKDKPVTSQGRNGTPLTRGAKRLLGMQMLKMMGRVGHGVKDISTDVQSLIQEVQAVNAKMDAILAIYAKQGVGVTWF